MNNHRVLALSDSLNPWHSFWIRIGQYLPALGLPYRIDSTVRAVPIDEGSQFSGLCHQRRDAADWRNPETVLLYRFAPQADGFLPALQRAKASGTQLIADIDDDLWSPSAGLPLGREKWNQGRLRHFNRILRLCDRITCSTPALGELVSVMFPNSVVVLLPNTVPAGLKSHPSGPADRGVRLGWTGAPWCRPDDLAPLRPLAAWSRHHSEISFLHLGHAEGRLSFAEALGLDPSRVQTQPLQPHADYVQQLHFDIGLAPLNSSLFNHFKSDLKLLEYSAAGIAWAASAVEPYRQLAENWGVEPLLCHSPSDFITVVERLLDPSERAAMASQLQLQAGSRSFEHGVERWRQLITGR